MGWFTAFPEDVYQENNHPASFEVAPGFTLDAAGALAWAAQLAYEVYEDGKLDRILQGWNWQKKAVLSGQFASTLPLVSTKGFVAECPGGTVIAFAGTEPTDLLNWITDFDVHQDQSGIADGFSAGVEAVFAPLVSAVSATGDPLLFAGHSLGGALAAVAAIRLVEKRVVPAARISGVYTIGMPRVGDAGFAAKYEVALGYKTYRLVHGDDIVSKVPPSEAPFNFRHVGQLLSCHRRALFSSVDVQPPTIEQPEVNAAQIPALWQSNGPDAEVPLPTYPGEHLLARVAAAELPAPLRDHLTDGYLRALGALKDQ